MPKSGGIPATKAATDVNEALILGAADFATDMVDLFFCDWSIWRWQCPSGSADAIQKSNQAGYLRKLCKSQLDLCLPNQTSAIK
jgi:hypothetical protein